MNNATLMKIALVLVIAIGVFAVTRLISPAPANAPSISEATLQPVVSDDPEFVQYAPITGPVTTTTVQGEPSSVPVADQALLVSITDEGFAPAAITVPLKTQVIFTNNGQALHWPASNDHPSHSILPGFDAKKGLATGESYSYTFTKKGAWKFHDHLNISLQGTITVQ